MNKIALYTANLGGYDVLKDYNFHDQNIDYFVFTDNYEYTSEKATVIYLEPSGYINKVLSRRLKATPHLLFPDHEITVWVDGCFSQVKTIKPLLDMLNGDIVTMQHSDRNCAYSEADAVRLMDMSSPKIVNAQMLKYIHEGFPKNYGLSATGIMIRKNIESVNEMNELWCQEITEKCHRDQLSFEYACWVYDLSVNRFNYNDIEKYFYTNTHLGQRK